MITIIDYGLGNIQAFKNLYGRLNIPVRSVDNAAGLEGSQKLILPGVGDFDHAMELLNNSGMREKLDQLVLDDKVPVLGVCVGMQILAPASDEGDLPGLGWIKGHVGKFDPSSHNRVIRLPHMGWNSVNPVGNHPLFEGLETDARFYFLHSYYFQHDREENILASTEYGNQFTSSVYSNNIYGVQFHPEKSHRWGIRLLKNYAEM